LNALDFQADPKPLFAGWRVARFARVGSTNDEARRLALGGDAGRLWVVAKEQTHGRGRKGRFWSSPPGNLYASALVVDPCPPALAPQIGFVAGVALAQAVEDLGGVGFGLKWPNDLMWRGAKTAGLLAEGVTTPDRRLACVVGIGVNCVSAPDGLDYPAASLGDALAQTASADALFVRLATRFHEALGLTGIIVTKLDGTARGGMIVGIVNEFDLPIRYIGIGESVEDLRPFDAREFAESLFAGAA